MQEGCTGGAQRCKTRREGNDQTANANHNFAIQVRQNTKARLQQTSARTKDEWRERGKRGRTGTSASCAR